MAKANMTSLTSRTFMILIFFCWNSISLLGGGCYFFFKAVEATPVTGILHCQNHEDCLGAYRECYRNSTMMKGRCICKTGFIQAKTNPIKCLNKRYNECESHLDCPSNVPCAEAYTSLDGFMEDFTFPLQPSRGIGPPRLDQAQAYMENQYQYNNMNHRDPQNLYGIDTILPKKIMGKRCIFTYVIREFNSDSGKELFQGMRPTVEFLDRYYNFGRRNRMHPGFHPEYIKFVEDAMLVMFLLCVLITLIIVHRASCYRRLRNSRRNGPLRYFIPHSDDRPPSYDNCEGDETQRVQRNNNNSALTDGPTASVGGGGGVQNGAVNGQRGVGAKPVARGDETPPPTYDEAIQYSAPNNETRQQITQQQQGSNRMSSPEAATASTAATPLYIALPAAAQSAAVENNQNQMLGENANIASTDIAPSETTNCSGTPVLMLQNIDLQNGRVEAATAVVIRNNGHENQQIGYKRFGSGGHQQQKQPGNNSSQRNPINEEEGEEDENEREATAEELRPIMK